MPMETVSIRDLRGATLRDRAREGKPLAITNHRVMIGVVIPVVPAWVEHIVCYNWSHVRQSIDEAEDALADGKPMTALPGVSAMTEAAGSGAPTRPPMPLVADLVGEAVAQTPRSKATLERLQAALNPQGTADQDPADDHSVERIVRIGDLSADMIERAGKDGETLAVTHDRELIGIIIPVTQGLVQFLIEQSLSRVVYNISLAEKELGTQNKMTTLDPRISPESA
jgi:antitoxin (DNA-binding transcriptional repressor) of toxin-antitoxin stability system